MLPKQTVVTCLLVILTMVPALVLYNCAVLYACPSSMPPADHRFGRIRASDQRPQYHTQCWDFACFVEETQELLALGRM